MDPEDVDPGTLLEWLDGNLSIQDDERALQANALERLCMLLLMSNNVDRCFESFSPDIFIPALCRIFLDEASPAYVLEVAARALTYFLDISNECAYRVIAVEGSLHAIASKLSFENGGLDGRTEIDLAEQCIKILSRMSAVDCYRELNGCVHFLIDLLATKWQLLHNDCIHSGLKVVQRLCRSKPVDMYSPSTRQSLPDTRLLFESCNDVIVDKLLWSLPFLFKHKAPMPYPFPVRILTNSLLTSIMCRYVSAEMDASFIYQAHVPGESLDIRMAESLMYCIFEKPRWQLALSRQNDCPAVFGHLSRDETARYCILHLLRSPAPFPEDAHLKHLIHWRDSNGNDLLSWAAALGSPYQVLHLLVMGFDPSDAIHLTACAGKLDNMRLLLQFGADFENLDDIGRMPMALAEERMKTGMVQLLSIASIFWAADFTVCPGHYLLLHKLSSDQLSSYIEALMSTEFATAQSFRLLYKLCCYLAHNKDFFIWICRIVPDISYRLTDIILQCLSSGAQVDSEVTVLALRISYVLIHSVAFLFNSHFIRLGVAEKIRKIRDAIVTGNQELINSEEIVFGQVPINQLPNIRQTSLLMGLQQQPQPVIVNRQFFVANPRSNRIPGGGIGANIGNIRPSLGMQILRHKPFAWGIWKVIVTSDYAYIFNDYNVIELGRMSPRGQIYSYRDNLLYFMNLEWLAESTMENPSVTHDCDCSQIIYDLDQYMSFKQRFLFASSAIASPHARLNPLPSLRDEYVPSSQYATSVALDLSTSMLPSSDCSDNANAEMEQGELRESGEINGQLTYPSVYDIDYRDVSTCSVNMLLLGQWSMHYSPDNLSCPAFIVHESQPKQVIGFKSDIAHYFYVEFDGKKRVVASCAKLPVGLEFPVNAEQIDLSSIPSRTRSSLRLRPSDQGGPATEEQLGETTCRAASHHEDLAAMLNRIKTGSFRKQSLDLCDYLVQHFEAIDASVVLEKQNLILNDTYLHDIQHYRVQLLNDIRDKKFTKFEMLSSSLTDCLSKEDIVSLFRFYSDHPALSMLADIYLSELDEQLGSLALMDSYWPVVATGRQLLSNGENRSAQPTRQSIRSLGSVVKLGITIDSCCDLKANGQRLHCESPDCQHLPRVDKRSSALVVNYICIDQLIAALQEKLVLRWWQARLEDTYMGQEIIRRAPVHMHALSIEDTGIIHWIATNGHSCRWVDPGKAGLIAVQCSSERNVLNGRSRVVRRRPHYSDQLRAEGLVQPTHRHDHYRMREPRIYRIELAITINADMIANETGNALRKPFFQIDLGMYIRPTAYKFTWDTEQDRKRLPLYWLMQFSADLKCWTRAVITGSSQLPDGLLFKLAELKPNTDTFKTGFRYFRFEHGFLNVSDESVIEFDLSHFDLFGIILRQHRAEPISEVRRIPEALMREPRTPEVAVGPTNEHFRNLLLAYGRMDQSQMGSRAVRSSIQHMLTGNRGMHDIVSGAIPPQSGGGALVRLPHLGIGLRGRVTYLNSSLDYLYNRHAPGALDLQNLGPRMTNFAQLSYGIPLDMTRTASDGHAVAAAVGRQQPPSRPVEGLPGLSRESRRRLRGPSRNQVRPDIAEMRSLLEEFSTLEGHHQDMMVQSLMDLLMVQETLYGSSSRHEDRSSRYDSVDTLAEDEEMDAEEYDEEEEEDEEEESAQDSCVTDQSTEGSEQIARARRILLGLQRRHQLGCYDAGGAGVRGANPADGAPAQSMYSHQTAWDPNVDVGLPQHAGEMAQNAASGIIRMPSPSRIRYHIDRTSWALISAYDPRPYQFNESSTRDISRQVVHRTLKERMTQNPILDDIPCKVGFILEFNEEHPDIQRLKVKQRQRALLPGMSGCLFWHMRQMTSLLDKGTREELNGLLSDKLFRIRVCNLDCLKAALQKDSEDPVHLGGDLASMPWDSRLPTILRQLFALKRKADELSYMRDPENVEINALQFCSNRLTDMVNSLLGDPLTVATSSMPTWIDQLVKQMPFLLSFAVRLRYFQALSFGTTRSLIWILQDTNHDRDFNIARYIGRLKKERCSLRRTHLLEDSCNLLEFHAPHKSELELVWDGEDGTGLGPTMEFYTLCSSELMSVSHGLWLTGSHQTLADFVHTQFGLFPAPYPRDHPKLPEVCRLFRILGMLIGKCLQDGRQCSDLNLSRPLLKMLCPPVHHRQTSGLLLNNRQFDPFQVLEYDDFMNVQPERARIFEQLGTREERSKIDGMCFFFNYLPSNGCFGFSECALTQSRNTDEVRNTLPVRIFFLSSKAVTEATFDEYVEATWRFVMRDGIEEQVIALRDGISRVLPIEGMNCFILEELHGLICGDLTPNWTREDLLQYVEPRNGYTRENETYQYLIDTLVELNERERKDVIQFITGCRTLPIGGIAALTPPLTVAKKDGFGYPSVNTCSHFLKLPEYTSRAELKEKLLNSCVERGFYFN